MEWADDAYFMENGSVALITPEGVRAALLDGTPLEVRPVKVAFEMATSDASVYAHHTLREIMEQPEVVARALAPRPEIELAARALRAAGRVFAVGAGTSYHAAMVARYVFAEVAGVDLQPVLASEHDLFLRWMDAGSVVLAISQSGETADVLEAVRAARARGARIVSIVNVPHSTLERESDLSVNVRAGPEVGVAATKSFTAQLSTLFSMALEAAGRPPLDAERLRQLERALVGGLRQGGRGEVEGRDRRVHRGKGGALPGGARGGAQGQGAGVRARGRAGRGRAEAWDARHGRGRHSGGPRESG